VLWEVKGELKKTAKLLHKGSSSFPEFQVTIHQNNNSFNRTSVKKFNFGLMPFNEVFLGNWNFKSSPFLWLNTRLKAQGYILNPNQLWRRM
jgi:hypothetical protein